MERKYVSNIRVLFVLLLVLLCVAKAQPLLDQEVVSVDPTPVTRQTMRSVPLFTQDQYELCIREGICPYDVPLNGK